MHEVKFSPFPANLSWSRQDRANHRKRMIALMTASDKEQRGELFHTLTYDFEIAAITTNLAQLEEIGYFPTMKAWNAVTGEGAHWRQQEMLADLAVGLSQLGIYLVRTNGLDDAELWEKLVTKILVEEVRDFIHGGEVHEYIDLRCGDEDGDRVSNRDEYFASLVPASKKGSER